MWPTYFEQGREHPMGFDGKAKYLFPWLLSTSQLHGSSILSNEISMSHHQDKRKPMKWRNAGLWGSMADFLYANQAYKYVFTSPSLVDRELKATQSGNAHLHSMISVTIASIAYITTQALI
ncbi:uncharacterized protein BJ212DRAFT_1299354 [Suillus subaureus]|uniref:Uncharacterized protein n=1 Tax=Suillus subaureus TaxID=48587 RepID=A0A9P7JE90_9AGAM|nr:uncharacterized protein BJ212DRAFT_1299354 [Suillus subaureus]KAG1817195.1 hypothetical protein BJ212DRAFT_1299354 [Suillus subaureus]